MTMRAMTTPAPVGHEGLVEGIAALRRSILMAARPEDAVRDVVRLAGRQLGAHEAGVWVNATTSWMGLAGAASPDLDTARSRGEIRDGVLRFPLLARGRDLGVLVGRWTPPAGLDLARCMAFEELSEYAAMALLTSPGGLSASMSTSRPAATIAEPVVPAPPTSSQPAVPPVDIERTGATAAPAAASSISSASDQSLLAALRSAVMNDEIQPHYQPIIRLSDGVIVGFEALARWEHPTRGWVSPGEFIPLAERHGLIAGLGMRILNGAARQSAKWARIEGNRPVRLVINLSPVQLQSRSLVTEVGNLVRRHRLTPGRIVLELTSHGSYDTARTAGLLERFEGAGVRIAVGDPESLQHLRASAQAVAADFVKVQRRLVGSLSSTAARAQVERLVRDGAAAGVQIAAEGVETDEELSALRGLGVELAQGFLWSPAVPVEEATAMIAAQPWLGGKLARNLDVR